VAQDRGKVAATDATCSMAKHHPPVLPPRKEVHVTSEAAGGTSSPHFLLALTAGAAGKPATAHPESTRG
jgi:hypothetical protein